MYLSRLIIRNFRSIKKLDLNFNESKNVIIGRNNSGKSNIVKALDKVLGSGSPTYSKSENISENDFFSWKDTHSPHRKALPQLEKCASDHQPQYNHQMASQRIPVVLELEISKKTWEGNNLR